MPSVFLRVMPGIGSTTKVVEALCAGSKKSHLASIILNAYVPQHPVATLQTPSTTSTVQNQEASIETPEVARIQKHCIACSSHTCVPLHLPITTQPVNWPPTPPETPPNGVFSSPPIICTAGPRLLHFSQPIPVNRPAVSLDHPLYPTHTRQQHQQVRHPKFSISDPADIA